MKKLDTKDTTANRFIDYDSIKLNNYAQLLVDVFKNYGSLDNLNSENKKECLDVWSAYFENQPKSLGIFLDNFFSTYFFLMKDVSEQQERFYTNTKDFDKIVENHDKQKNNLIKSLAYLQNFTDLKLDNLRHNPVSLWSGDNLSLNHHLNQNHIISGFIEFVFNHFPTNNSREKTQYICSMGKRSQSSKIVEVSNHFIVYLRHNRNFKFIEQHFDIERKEAQRLYRLQYHPLSFEKGVETLTQEMLKNPILPLKERYDEVIGFFKPLSISEYMKECAFEPRDKTFKNLEFFSQLVMEAIHQKPLSAVAQQGVESVVLYFLQLNQVRLQSWKTSHNAKHAATLPDKLKTNEEIEQKLQNLLQISGVDKTLEDFYPLVASPAMAKLVKTHFDFTESISEIQAQMTKGYDTSLFIKSFPLNSFGGNIKIMLEKTILELELCLSIKPEHSLTKPVLKI